MHKHKTALLGVWLQITVLIAFATAGANDDGSATRVVVASPDGRNSITLEQMGTGHAQMRFTIARDGAALIGPSVIGPKLTAGGVIGEHARIRKFQTRKIDEKFALPWGKTRDVVHRGAAAIIDLESDKLSWQIELRAYDDGVAFRYRLPRQDDLPRVDVADEATRFDIVGNPNAIFNSLKNFTTSHEALYCARAVSKMPSQQLMDMPLLMVWPKGPAAAITEGRVRSFAGMYLERAADDANGLACRLSPLPGRKDVCVSAKPPVESPWRVVLLGDTAGKLLESNLLLCLNDPPHGDFEWALPGKTSFPWWNADFENDYKLPDETKVFVDRNKRYIDFCAKNNIAYHAVHGDGRAWYPQSSNSYGTASDDADVRVSRPELDLPAIIAYGRVKGVGIRLWVHWKPLSRHLEDAFTNYEAWGVKGLMVDFLDRDDQEMLDFTDRMMESRCTA